MFEHIPVSVYLIFVGLVWLGLRLSRERIVSPRAVGALAIGMLGFSGYGMVSAFSANVVPLLSWACGVALAIIVGRRGAARDV